MSEPKYIHLTCEDTHKAGFSLLSPIVMLTKAKKAYVQQIARNKAAVYLQNEDTQELQALWVGFKFESPNIVYLLPHQKKTRGKSDPCYYFHVTYWQHEEFVSWLKSFDLTVYYAAGLGTSYHKA